ncbi:MAG TPA: copper homeostasis protein CutC [Pseudonocardiaceae bacterium]|nr:copper homeostasis protein CutC [Pseudonocardiaceae bacterium]
MNSPSRQTRLELPVRLELSVDSVDAAIAANSLDVQRIELCSAGALGGLTPGPGLLDTVLTHCRQVEVHVLIRPRAGDFHYSPTEIEAMIADVGYAASAGAAGVVIGALTDHDDPDYLVLTDLTAAAAGCEVTFHRAIDVCRAPLAAIERLAARGVRRVLSSGQANRAEQGAPLLAEMVRVADGGLAVMACGGIRAHNARAVLAATGVDDIHAAPRRTVPAARKSTVDFGGHAEFDLDEALALISAVGAAT